MAELAIRGGTPVRSTPWPNWPVHDDEERRLLLEVLDSGAWWATEGTKVREFEAAFGSVHGTGPAVAVTNGTHSIEVACTALGIGDGDEVIVPSWSFIATAAAVLMVNAIPILVDVDLRTGCIDVAAAEAAITDRTAAIICVHIAGHPADMDALEALCTRRGLALIEDCAHAHGSTWNGRPVGTFGDAGSYSFQSSKLMTAGEGGAIVSRRPEVLAACRSFGDCGRRPGEWFYSHYALGGNYRMTEWQGAILLAQLGRFDEQQSRRRTASTYLNNELAQLPGVHPQTRDPRCEEQGNYCYVLRIDPDIFGASREQIRVALQAEGIALTMSYPAIHRIELFQDPKGFEPRFRATRASLPDYASLTLPVSERLADTTLWFRTQVLMGSPEDTSQVVEALAKVAANVDELRDLPVNSWRG